VTVGGRKMSKSLNNFVTLKSAFEKYKPLVVRFFILQSHYRSTLDYSDDAIGAAQTGVSKLWNTVRTIRDALARSDSSGGDSGKGFLPLEEYTRRFTEAMDDDFNTPQAIGVLFDCARDVNALIHGAEPPSAATLRDIDQWFRVRGGEILGILPDSIETGDDSRPAMEASLIELLIELRAAARQQKLWSFSDTIRDGLKAMGIVLEDTKEGTTWKRVDESAPNN